MSGIRIDSALWLLMASGGMIVMSSAFVALYATVGIGCAADWHRTGLAGSNLLTVILVALWLAHLAVLGILQWYGWSLARRAVGTDRGTARMLGRTTCLIVAIGLASTIFIGFPVLMLPPCA